MNTQPTVVNRRAELPPVGGLTGAVHDSQVIDGALLDPLICDAHVLVIDGDDTVSERSREVLEGAGYQVSTADLPDIGIVRRLMPDVVLLCLFYRGRSTGLDFLEHHVADLATRVVPIVVQLAGEELSAHDRQRLSTIGGHVVTALAEPTGLLAQVASARNHSHV